MDTDNKKYGVIVGRLLKSKVLQEKDIQYAERIRAKLTAQEPLLNVLKNLKLITDETIRATISGSQLDLRIGDLLVELGYLNADDLEAAFKIQQEREKDLKFGEILIKYNFIEEKLFYRVLSLQLGFPLVNPDISYVDKRLVAKSPLRILISQAFLPLKTADGTTLVAFKDPTDQVALQAARRLFGTDIRPAVADKKALLDTLRLLNNEAAGIIVNIDNNSIIGIVNSIILAAISDDVSDIHLEPSTDGLHIRFRKDGVLYQYKDFPKDTIPALISRIKIMCKADIA
ncbi:MAG: secretion system protein E, partial [Desulfobulbaceae bacterium]